MNDWRISIVKKVELDQHQFDVLNQATVAGRSEPGPCCTWDNPVCLNMLRVIVLNSNDLPIGLFHIGGPLWMIDIGWWIQPEYRGRGYCSEALDLLADTLKAEGATGLAKILIQDTEYARSRHLLDRFVKRFFDHG